MQVHRSQDRELVGVQAVVQVQGQQEQALNCKVQVMDHLAILLRVEIQVDLRSSMRRLLFHRRHLEA